MLLTHRTLLQSKAIAIGNDLRGTLRNFGLKVGIAGKVKFEARIKELVKSFPDLAVPVEPLLVVRRVLREQLSILHRRLLVIVQDDNVCRLLMTVPSVGLRCKEIRTEWLFWSAQIYPGPTWELVLGVIMVVRTHLIFLFGRPLWSSVDPGFRLLGRPLCHPFQITPQTRVGVFPQLLIA
jgi:hypothetical protein